ncbi:aldehyde dehydrogenase family protein [Salmonella enterica subsp. enterica serovar Dublin]|nr:aldehyde dehydrogenase family protein [Salmonella enterica subsp. enterica serovar Dublin]
MSTNPLLDQSMLPYQAPRFDRIKDCHYRPAFDEGVRQKRVEIEAIVNHPAAPDFTNTLLALEQSGALLSRVTSIFFAMTAAHTNDELQRLDEAFSAELAALSNDIYLNSALFARVDAVWQQRHSLGLDDESLRLVDVIHQRFVLAGAQLAEEDKAQLKVLNTESATLMSQFNQRLLAASKAGGLAVDDAHCLAGLSPEEMTVAAEAAREKGLEERWFIPLLNTTQQPALATLRDRQTRENLFAASWTRAEKGDAHDTRAIVQRLVEIRRCQAKLLGFPNYAAWKMADQMAKTPQAALSFMRGIVPPARQRVLTAFRQELFGPVAAITVAKDAAHALALANDSEFGLSATIFTADDTLAAEMAARLECGGVFINGYSASDARVAFGGVKKSGFGRELSHFGLHEFCNVQTVWKNRV